LFRLKIKKQVAKLIRYLSFMRGGQMLTGGNLKVVWAKFSTLG